LAGGKLQKEKKWYRRLSVYGQIMSPPSLVGRKQSLSRRGTEGDGIEDHKIEKEGGMITTPKREQSIGQGWAWNEQDAGGES